MAWHGGSHVVCAEGSVMCNPVSVRNLGRKEHKICEMQCMFSQNWDVVMTRLTLPSYTERKRILKGGSSVFAH